MLRRTTGLVVLATLAATGCSASSAHRPSAADRVTPPRLGACHALTVADIGHASDPSAAVACTKPHTAQTFAIGQLPASTGSSYTDPRHGRWIYPTCERAFERFLGVDASRAMRIQLSWAWFRPSRTGWAKGARWYRCDLVGGPQQATSLRALPVTGRGLFRALPPEQWLTCARGPHVKGSTKVPCSEKHDWRAISTIKLGAPKDPYPGDRISEVRSRDYCSQSVAALMNYPPDYEFGYTYFHAAEWKAGNRRSICWARTEQ